MKENIKYEDLKAKQPTVYVIQEIAGTKVGNPKINIMGASRYSSSGKFNFLLPEFSQIIFSPGPLVYKLRQGLKDFTKNDYLLLMSSYCKLFSFMLDNIGLHPYIVN